ncbi:MAG: beta-galactosidase [Lachnospiraceae bacterium]
MTKTRQAQNIHFGVDYYPEHWDRTRWETDAKLMQEMGIQVVRMAEFSWHKLEPEEGRYDFTWLDDVISLLADYGIKTILGTPSAAPPAWMIQKHSDILPIDREGRVRGFGGRHHDCQSNPAYRSYIRKMVTNLAKQYGENENVIGWQVDNELGNSHQDLCTCDHCKNRFQTWLREKYHTTDQLNAAWGTAFWSQEYNNFSEIHTPRITVTGENPSAMLDWKRFCSDLIVDFAKEQADIIRKYAKDQFVTHNYMGFADKVDYYKLSEILDFVAHDQYPQGFYLEETPHEKNHVLAATLDVVRSYKNMPFWIMEQQSGITGWEVMGRAPAPGQLSLWALQSVAHGADAVVFFRWRTCAMGTEQYWHGILPHSGNPGRRYAELKDMIQTMSPIMEEIKGSMPKTEVGIVFSFDQDYAFTIQPHHKDLNYIHQVQKYYQAFYEQNIPVDFVQESGDFAKYRLLVAPLQYLMNPELEEKYISYVKNGGHLVLTMRTGVKDEHNLCMTDRELPGRLSEIAGIEVLDYDCLWDTEVEINYQDQVYKGVVWSDLMQLVSEHTKTMASYASEFYAGEPCVTAHPYGKGICYYIGTEPKEELMQALMEDICKQAEISALANKVTEVEFMTRENETSRYLFILNHSNESREYELPDTEYHMIKGETAGRISPYEVQILKKNL